MKRILAIFVLLILIKINLISQVGFDYLPKSLVSQLSKANISQTDLKELTLTPVITRSVPIGKYFFVPVNGMSTSINYVYVGRVNTCRTGGCSIAQNFEGESEFFDYYILFDVVGNVQQVKIYNYQSTHGQEVTSTSWLKQFRNYNGKQELVVGKNVDAISGATISVNATVYDIEAKTKILHSLID